MKLTKDDLEVTRKWWLEKSTSPEHASLVVQICDAALQALSQPKDVKRPEFWSEERLRDFEQNVIDADKLTPQIRALQAYIEQQDAEIADIIEEKDGYKFSAKAFEGAFEECRLNLSALEQPTAQGWRPIEESPKETDILVCGLNHGKGPGVWMFTAYQHESGAWYNHSDDDNPTKEFVPEWITHFQPLPQPPRSEVSNG